MTAPLSSIERRWAHAAFGTIFPGPERGSLPLGIEDLDLDAFLDDSIGTLPFEASLGLRLAIWVIALAPLFVLGKLATIASLRPDDRERTISIIAASPVYAIRSTVIMLKAMGALFYCGDHRIRARVMSVASSQSPTVVPLRLRASSVAVPAKLGADHEQHRRIA